MKTNKLSSDEINGLLGQNGTTDNASSKDFLTKVEMEALTEVLNVSLGGSATVLSSLFSEQISVRAAELSIKQRDQLLSSTRSPFIVVLGEYTGGINGIQLLSLAVEDVQVIAEMMDSGRELKHMREQFQVVEEVFDQMFTSVSQSMGTVLELEVAHSISSMDLIESHDDFPIEKFTEEQWFVEAHYHLVFGTENTISIHLCIPVHVAKQMVNVLTDSLDEDNPEETQEMQFQSTNQSTTDKSKDAGSIPNVQSVQFSSFDETNSDHSEPNNLNMLLDIPLQVTVELGRTKRMVKEILAVSQGSIIELDKLAGEPVDILINNKLIAVGEVVVIDENFGVRVTDILSTADRISKLR
ncbi:flagellar motor switch phosphatase FliY [Paenisporosarcina sp.]|uniref:flagellar motor switch phosphatase FliY n=1 Tax=Paenisporosarcina sp. TaxID=1932001 RepID=UPI003C78CAF1